MDSNKRLIKRSAFLKMLGGMGVVMTPAASAFAYGGCATGSYYAQYYAGVNFDTLRKSQCEAAPLDNNWGTGAISPMVRADNMSARWTGDFNFQQPGEYEFTATADDGIRVYVDGVRIIDEWRDQAARTFKARRQLAAGIHQVIVEYYERLGYALCSCSWALVSSPPQSSVRGLGAVVDTSSWPNYGVDIDAFNAKAQHDHKIIVTFDRFGEYGLNTGKLETFSTRNIHPVWTWEPYAASLASINSGDYDGWIDTQADLIANFPDTICYIRFAHEMNGNWFPWGKQPAAYRAAFARVAQRVRSRAPNARMMWCPNVGWPTIRDYYPGDAYVDWLAIDGYNFDGNLSPTDVFANTYDQVAALSASKPMMIPETASTEYAGKPNWITTLYTDAIPNRMPRVKAVAWFDLLKERDWRVNSSQAALDAYRAVADRPEWGWGAATQGDGYNL